MVYQLKSLMIAAKSLPLCSFGIAITGERDRKGENGKQVKVPS